MNDYEFRKPLGIRFLQGVDLARPGRPPKASTYSTGKPSLFICQPNLWINHSAFRFFGKKTPDLPQIILFDRAYG